MKKLVLLVLLFVMWDQVLGRPLWVVADVVAQAAAPVVEMFRPWQEPYEGYCIIHPDQRECVK